MLVSELLLDPNELFVGFHDRDLEVLNTLEIAKHSQQHSSCFPSKLNLAHGLSDQTVRINNPVVID